MGPTLTISVHQNIERYKMVYLLHFDRILGDPTNPHGSARHYLGYCDPGDCERDFSSPLSRRLAQHQAGTGAAITAACVERGIRFQVVRVWAPADRAWERRLKNGKRGPLLCPVCNGSAAWRLATDIPSWQPGEPVKNAF
jgi:hypothetical protein